AGAVDDRVFIAMEHVEGHHLGRWLASDERSVDEILAVFLAAGRGLAAAHDAGVVHRDFKPGNVLVGDDQRVRVCDFGIAQNVAEDGVDAMVTIEAIDRIDPWRLQNMAGSAARTRVGGVGTPGYIAPEQAAGGAVGAAADQYSFCVALHRALVGRRSGASGSGVDRRAARFEPMLRRGLDEDPACRYPSMHALLDALAPRPRRRRRQLAAAVGAALVAAGVAWIARPAVEDDACSGGAARMAEVWNPAARASLASGWGAAGGALGGAIFQGLDQRRDAWVERFAESCRATRRGEQSEDLLDRRMACLEERRQELGWLLGELAGGTSADLASRALAALPALDRCDDRAALSAPTAVVDAATERAVADVRQQLAAVRVKRLVGRYDDAISTATDSVETARRLGYWPLIAESLFEQARSEEHGARPGGAVEVYRDALLAAEAGRHDRIAVEAFLRLVRLAGYHEGDLDRAEEYASMASALLQHLGDRRRLQATLENHLGLLRYQQGEYRAAWEHHRRALRIAWAGDELARSRSFRLLDAVTHLRLGAAARALGWLEDADDAYERALGSYRAVYGATHPEVAMVLDRQGGVALDRGDDERAERLRETSFEILVETLGERDPRTLDALNNLGVVVLKRGRYERALALFEQLDATYRECGGAPVKLAEVASNLGSSQLGLGRGDEALVAFEMALDLQVATYGADHPATALARYNLAEALNELERFDAALDHHRRALASWRARLGDQHYLIAHGVTGEGRALLGLGRGQEAVVGLRAALGIWEDLDRDPFYAAETRWLFARALALEGERQAAAEQAQRAVDIFAATSGREALVAEIETWLRDV
ncbi:MAG: tetratricopeptide repeat protein, partial [Acidobacteriota bacterium]